MVINGSGTLKLGPAQSMNDLERVLDLLGFRHQHGATFDPGFSACADRYNPQETIYRDKTEPDIQLALCPRRLRNRDGQLLVAVEYEGLKIADDPTGLIQEELDRLRVP